MIPDLTPIIYLAYVGLVAAILLTLAAVGGLAYILYLGVLAVFA